MTSPERPCDAAWYPRAWTVWATCVLASFAVLEAAALAAGDGSGRTLSAQLRRRREASGLAIAAFALWSIHHIVVAGRDATEERP